MNDRCFPPPKLKQDGWKVPYKLFVDSVAVKFVADAWVSASAAEKAAAMRVAAAARHIEIGLSSFAELTLGATLLLYGLAIELSGAYHPHFPWSRPRGANTPPGSFLTDTVYYLVYIENVYIIVL